MTAPQPCIRCAQPSTRGTCTACARQQATRRDKRRPTAAQRGYTGGHLTFRRQVLARDPWCTCPGCPSCTGPTQCLRDSTDADHHPVDRTHLVATGQDPDDPQHGRGLCGSCHAHKSATEGRFGR